jgi:hypothetical protein
MRCDAQQAGTLNVTKSLIMAEKRQDISQMTGTNSIKE